MYKIKVWNKKYNKGKNTYYLTKGKIIKEDGTETKVHDVALSKAVREKLQKSRLDLPLTLTLYIEDFFLSKGKFEDKHGLEREKYTIVVMDYEKAELLEFESKTDLSVLG